MEQMKPVLSTQSRGPRPSCWKVTAAAAVVGSVTALYLGILLGECAARYLLSACLLKEKRNGLCSSQSS